MDEATPRASYGPLLRYFDHKQSFRNLTAEHGAAFMWFQLVCTNFCSIPYDYSAIDDMEKAFSAYLKEHGTPQSIKALEEVIENYKPNIAIICYTRNMSMLLNKALISEDIDSLYAFRAYIHDLSEQIRLESQKLKEPLRLYHGRKMKLEELERLKSASVGSLISINGYLSTSKNEDVALAYAYDALFDINYDSCSLKYVHAADIAEQSNYPEEKEVLFDINSVFEITGITEEVNVCQVCPIIRVFMKATDKGSETLSKYILLMEDENKEDRDTIHVRLLFKMGEYTKV
jgi:hypothetical protein